MTVIESLVSGLPIISTSSGGIPEYANEGSAVLLNRDDKLIDNISIEIENLLSDDNKMKMMSKQAKKISSNLTKENYYDDFCSLFLECDNDE